VALVEVRNLYKSFTRGTEKIDVLMDLSLDVNAGEFIALMGPSGSGKTTLLNLIAGLDSPSEGSIKVNNDVISSLTESELARWRTRNVGFVFQFYNLLPVLTAYENVELPLLLLPLSATQRRKQVENALGLVGLSDRMTHRPGQLSGGQCQRVGIARAIVTDPTIIVADEPTGALDATSAEAALDLLNILRQELGKTVLMVTHDPHAAERAQHIVKLEKGRLVLGS
jgi:putative ABC transport system ATP-binding protein